MSGNFELAARMAALSPAGVIETDRDIVAAHSRDQCSIALSGSALALARPRSSEEVAAVLRAAASLGIPIVPRGAGTGLAGAANAVDGCVVLSLKSMDQIIAIEPADLSAVVQPGVINTNLKSACQLVGLWYPPDPASADISTIGGNVATNAGGLCCIKYGTTRDYVLGIEVVLADGDIARFGHRTRKGVVGLDLTSLFVGSEGTLGVITEITVRLVPLPAPPRTVVAYYDDLITAGGAASVIATSGVQPSMLEIMDRATMEAVESFRSCGLELDMAGLVLAQTDAADVGDVRALTSALERSGAAWVGHSDDPADSAHLIAARKLAYPALERLGRVVLDDVAVPLSKVAAMMERIRLIGEQHGVRIATFGHAGDGNLHPTIIDEDAAATYRAFTDIVLAAQELGGTATGEHGVGSIKSELAIGELDPAALRLERAIKQELDPARQLNPGRGFGVAGRGQG